MRGNARRSKRVSPCSTGCQQLIACRSASGPIHPAVPLLRCLQSLLPSSSAVGPAVCADQADRARAFQLQVHRAGSWTRPPATPLRPQPIGQHARRWRQRRRCHPARGALPALMPHRPYRPPPGLLRLLLCAGAAHCGLPLQPAAAGPQQKPPGEGGGRGGLPLPPRGPAPPGCAGCAALLP